MNFDFLKTVEVTQEVKTAVRTSVDKLPTGLAIRVFGSGKVYPSKELVEKYNLEYANKNSENPGNGFDFFKSSEWSGFPADAPETYLFFAAVPKTSPKVSIFGSCGYAEDGTPKVSVLEQGGGKAGQELLAAIKDVFGVEVEKGSYVDLTIVEEISIPSNTGVYYLPKTTTKKDGTVLPDAVRRENIVVNPVTLAKEEVVDVEATEESAIAEVQTDASVDDAASNESNPFAQDVDEPAEVSDMPPMPQV
ncbi:hypothetical protein [Tenacibaculum sp.]|uniref:hypothetical protein n=1 Tax=Tenacibaculum sp. TaxID=1906242 RepID=UPI003D09B6A5